MFSNIENSSSSLLLDDASASCCICNVNSIAKCLFRFASNVNQNVFYFIFNFIFLIIIYLEFYLRTICRAWLLLPFIFTLTNDIISSILLSVNRRIEQGSKMMLTHTNATLTSLTKLAIAITLLAP